MRHSLIDAVVVGVARYEKRFLCLAELTQLTRDVRAVHLRMMISVISKSIRPGCFARRSPSVPCDAHKTL